MNIFWSMMKLWILFLVITNWTIFGVIYTFYGFFLTSRYRIRIFPLELLNSSILCGMPDIPDIFLSKQ